MPAPTPRVFVGVFTLHEQHQPEITGPHLVVSKEVQPDATETGVIDSSPDEYDVCLCAVFLHICAERQVPAKSLLDNFLEARLVNWEAVAVPGRNPGLIDVYNGHLHAEKLHTAVIQVEQQLA